MTDDELGTIVDTELRQSIAYMGGRLSEMRRKAEYYYLGEPVEDLAPPPVPDRSAVVSTDVSDTIEWTLPALMEIFTAGDDVVEFKERRADQAEAARQTTEVCNYVLYQQNPGWSILHDWIKDALLQKNGILKVWWDDKVDETREEYENLTDAQMAILLQDPEVEPVEHSVYPDANALQAAQVQYAQAMQQWQQAMHQFQVQMQQHPAAPQQPGQPPQPQPQPPQQPDLSQIPQLHAVTVKRTRKNGKVCIENVPPEEFFISRRAKNIPNAPFCGHRKQKTLSELRADGYENVDDLSSDDDGDLNPERIERLAWDDDYAWTGSDGTESLDPSARVVWISECYLQVDYDGDGIAEWRKVTRAGNKTLRNEECDGPPFVSNNAIRLPHRFFGLSLADLAMQSQRISTDLWRSALDNIHLQVNGRTFAVEGQVNLDDLLTTRPGQIVRIKQAGAVGPLQQGMADLAGVYQALEYNDTARQERTGVMKLTQGSDADILNKTSSGNARMTNRSDMRVKLIARVIAEGGMKDLFHMIQKLLSQYQDKEMTIKLTGGWATVDPRAWKNGYDMVVNVGLGTGDKTEIIQHVMMVAAAQEKALALGVATPENVYNLLKKLPPAVGMKNADDFFTDPAKQPPKPPQPPIELLKIQAQAQADGQLEQQRHQNEVEKTQAVQQVEALKAHLDQQTALFAQRAQAEQAQQQTQLEMQRDLITAHMEQQSQRLQMAFDAQMEQLKQGVAVQIAQIAAASRVEVAEAAAATTLQGAQIAAANQAGQQE
ncbi:hypothetical protein PQR01_00370 [Paraburkholderia rhynchosiae]|uniref:Uncharacterized protein n=1 Tax=Paraburkholderia rhynchosiae TaxID=487049 RepID=A0ACC7N2Y1_9BURK